MNLKKYAEIEGISLAKAKELTGLTHWKQEVQEFVPSEASESVTVADVIEDVIEIVDDPEVLKQARALQTCIGYKTPAYLRFVSEHKEEIQAEFERVKGLIARFVK